MSPPKFIMNTSLIMRLIITLIVFQCTARGVYVAAHVGVSAERLEDIWMDGGEDTITRGYTCEQATVCLFGMWKI